MSRWLCGHPEFVRGRAVHEVGAGVGLPGLVSASVGAASVLVSDGDPCAREVTQRACQHNAKILGDDRLRQVRVLTLDWFSALGQDFRPPAISDVLLAVDVNYYVKANTALLAMVKACLRPGGWLLLASRMGRAGLPGFLELLTVDPHFEVEMEESFVSDVDGAQDKVWIFRRHDEG